MALCDVRGSTDLKLHMQLSALLVITSGFMISNITAVTYYHCFVLNTLTGY